MSDIVITVKNEILQVSQLCVQYVVFLETSQLGPHTMSDYVGQLGPLDVVGVRLYAEGWFGGWLAVGWSSAGR